MLSRLFILSSLVITVGCGYYHESKEAQKGKLPFDFSKAALNYESMDAIVFHPYCFDCHDKPHGKRKQIFLNYDLVFAARDKIKETISDGSMPDDQHLPDKEYKIIMAWLNEGAPQFGDKPLPGQKAPGFTDPAAFMAATSDLIPPFTDTKEGFDTIKSKVIAVYCLDCHTEAKAKAKKPPLETYAEVFAVRAQIREDVESGTMPDDDPMPNGPAKLLIDWIDAGAPEKAPTAILDTSAQE